jgi:UDP-glucose 4-epimerase
MTIAVIGARGFIGAALVRALAAAGVQCTALSSADGAFDADTGLLRDAALAAAPLDAVVYLAQSPHYRDVPQHAAHLWAVNVVSAVKAAEWARRSGAARFVYASTGNVYQPGFGAMREDAPLRRDSWYALSKVQAEEALAIYRGDLTVTCARLFGVYGPHQSGKLVPNLVESVRAQRPIRLQPHPADPADTGGVRLSLAYLDDVVDTFRHLAVTDGPPVVNVAGPDVCSVQDIATRIGRRLKMAPVFVADPTPRESDLIADRERLSAVCPTPFRTFDEGLDLMLGAP